jgi:hypothetical protein
MVIYGSAKKAVIENKPNPYAGESEKQNESKKARNLLEAENTIEKLNDLLYNSMIDACNTFKTLMRDISIIMLNSKYEDFEEDDYNKLFTKLDFICTGKGSFLKAILMYVMTIQLYEVGSTDLDEVAEALRDAVEGLQYYNAVSTTMHSLKPELFEHNKNL